MQHLFDHRESSQYSGRVEDGVRVEVEGVCLSWPRPTDKIAVLGAKGQWTQDFHVEHEGTITGVTEYGVLPPLPKPRSNGPLFLWTPNTTVSVVQPPNFEILSHPSTPVSGVRALGDAVVGEHLARAEAELQTAMRRCIDLLTRHYRGTFGEDPAYIVTLVAHAPQVEDADVAGEAVVRGGKVEWDTECALGHLAKLDIALIACQEQPDGFAGPELGGHPYLGGLGLTPTERVVTADMDFRHVEVASFNRRSLEFARWWTEAHERREAGHKLTSWDDPLRRLIGFGDHDAAEVLQCSLTNIKRGMYQAEQGEITVPKPETIREALSTPKGRAALLTTPFG